MLLRVELGLKGVLSELERQSLNPVQRVYKWPYLQIAGTLLVSFEYLALLRPVIACQWVCRDKGQRNEILATEVYKILG